MTPPATPRRRRRGTVKVHNTGLVAAYGFEEASGTTAQDQIGLHNGTLAGATRVTTGRFGRALSFDGVDDSVTVPHDAALNLTSGMTLEAWVRPSALGSSLRSVLMKERPAGFDYSLLADTAASHPTANVLTTSAFEAAGPASLGLSTWTHLAQTWNGSTLRLYIDGAEVATQPSTGSLVTSTGQVRIGGTSGQFFSGLIDEVRIYNHARTAAEIAADMATAVKP